MYVPVVALRAYLEVLGKLPVNVKLLFEGEEEIGSPNLKRLLEDNARLLRADFSLSADGGQVSPSIPGICLGLRGSVALEVHVRVADVDLHSGQYGGGVQNPVHALAAILASLRDMRSGSVSVDGFYEDVRDIGDDLRADIRKFPRVQTDMLKGVGINESVGESGLSFLERYVLVSSATMVWSCVVSACADYFFFCLYVCVCGRTWARPSLEIVGITGGFQGDGLKTVLPREASAKLSARIVSLHTHTYLQNTDANPKKKR